MTTKNGNQVVIFVYSEMQMAEENQIAKRIGKRFVCGNIYSGIGAKQFTKQIQEDELPGMIARYPDTKIVIKGKIKDIKFEDVKYKLNINNY